MSRFDKKDQEVIKNIVKEAFNEMGFQLQDEIWVNSQRAMEILNCKRTQLFLLASDPSTGIVVSRMNRKNTLYLKSSLLQFIDKNILE
ncbi:hypothetical protein ACQY1Q_10450 [Tenacibaculum sp. TC6]|uniref:hypothetical protein n=1 Tax=Tenacibaculum sp. TC6 TaxID=3423223 RepID=UPI003D365C9A